MFRQQVNRPRTIPGPETNNWYWNPNRVGALEAPRWFRQQLKDVDPDNYIDVRWNPVKERWGVFYKKPSVQHKICSGWALLFMVQDADGEFQPLDERVLARLYSASAQQWGNGKRYFESVQAQIEREKESREKQYQADLIDSAMPAFEHAQIKVSGFGPSSGSKFSTYHA